MSDEQLKVAKITAFQTIVVAIITALGGGIAGYFTAGSSHSTIPEEPMKQPWFVFRGIENSETLGDVRVVIQINDAIYSYPPHAIWANPSENMYEARFPLPFSPTGGYDLNIIIYEKSIDGDSDMMRTWMVQAFDHFANKDIPSNVKHFGLGKVSSGMRGERLQREVAVLYSLDY